MRWMKWTGIASAVLMVISCFSTWVVIKSRGIIVTGMESAGTNFGKPGYFHLLLTAFFIAFSLTPTLWAKRANIFVTAINMGWAIRNYLLISQCRGGECPVKEIWIYLMVGASLLMLVSALFPDMKVPVKRLS